MKAARQQVRQVQLEEYRQGKKARFRDRTALQAASKAEKHQLREEELARHREAKRIERTR
jgi:Tfp pilus assembly protein PilV